MTDKRLEKLLHVPRWPTAEEALQSLWFSPLSLGPTTLRHRTWVPAMVPWRAADDGEVTPQVLGWYERFAQGEPGALVVEATGIRDVPSGPLLRAGHDRFLPGLTRLAQTVHRASHGQTRVFLQLIDFLAIKRRPNPDRFFRDFLPVDAQRRARWAEALEDLALLELPEPAVRARLAALDEERLRRTLNARDLEALTVGYREHVDDLHLPHIRELPRTLPALFAAAARRCEEAGFDGVELHFAHAYTMASFLSAKNQRTDGYGGSHQARVRLPLEVYRAVRDAVGSRMVLGCRFLGDEVIDGGSRVDDAVVYGRAFAREGMDFLSLSKGGKFEDARQPRVGEVAYPYTGPSGHECMPTTTVHKDPPGPFGRNVPLAARVRRALRAEGLTTPVITCGGISSFWQAEEILARGDADVVAAARQTLADPDWFKKLLHGKGDSIRRCFFTNYCEGLDQKHKVVTCQRWDRLEGEGPRTPDGRRYLAPAWEDETTAGETGVARSAGSRKVNVVP
jgi:dimethylglycine catabolism A